MIEYFFIVAVISERKSFVIHSYISEPEVFFRKLRGDIACKKVQGSALENKK